MTSVSLVVPVYRNEGSIAELLGAIRSIAQRLGEDFEAVFVVDGSPDQSHALLRALLPGAGFRATLVALSRNFGAFSAIRVGLERAEGEVVAVMAADLQEPPELVIEFTRALASGAADVAFGVRQGRADPWMSKLASNTFWAIYRRFVMPDIPRGGVDVFAVSRQFRANLLRMGESNTSLLAQLFWLGGRRVFVPYERRERRHGRSAWTLSKKLKYLGDSLFAFTDLPVRLLITAGLLGMATSLVLGIIVLAAKLTGLVDVPGYTPLILSVLFFGALNSLGLGVVGSYAWRGYENTKARPLAVVQSEETFQGVAS